MFHPRQTEVAKERDLKHQARGPAIPKDFTLAYMMKQITLGTQMNQSPLLFEVVKEATNHTEPCSRGIKGSMVEEVKGQMPQEVEQWVFGP